MIRMPPVSPGMNAPIPPPGRRPPGTADPGDGSGRPGKIPSRARPGRSIRPPPKPVGVPAPYDRGEGHASSRGAFGVNAAVPRRFRPGSGAKMGLSAPDMPRSAHAGMPFAPGFPAENRRNPSLTRTALFTPAHAGPHGPIGRSGGGSDDASDPPPVWASKHRMHGGSSTYCTARASVTDP